MMDNGQLILEVLFGLIDRASTIAALLNKAKAEQRDVTDAELDTLSLADDLARAQLIVAIARRRAEEAKQA
jgi:hypothetical protein